MEKVRKVCAFQRKTGRISYFLCKVFLRLLVDAQCSDLMESNSTMMDNSGNKLIDLVLF